MFFVWTQTGLWTSLLQRRKVVDGKQPSRKTKVLYDSAVQKLLDKVGLSLLDAANKSEWHNIINITRPEALAAPARAASGFSAQVAAKQPSAAGHQRGCIDHPHHEQPDSVPIYPEGLAFFPPFLEGNGAFVRCFFFQWVKSVEEGAGGGGSACVTGWPDQRPAYSSSIMPNNLLWRMNLKGGLAGRPLSVQRERALHTTSATGNQRYSTTYLRNNQKYRTKLYRQRLHASHARSGFAF
jgi:hypothetical protein